MRDTLSALVGSEINVAVFHDYDVRDYDVVVLPAEAAPLCYPLLS